MLFRSLDQFDEVRDVPVLREDPQVVRDVVAAVAERGLVDGQQPDAVDAQPLEIVQPGGEAPDVTGAVTGVSDVTAGSPMAGSCSDTA